MVKCFFLSLAGALGPGDFGFLGGLDHWMLPPSCVTPETPLQPTSPIGAIAPAKGNPGKFDFGGDFMSDKFQDWDDNKRLLWEFQEGVFIDILLYFALWLAFGVGILWAIKTVWYWV